MHEKDIENRVFKHKGCVPSVDFSTKSSQSRKDYTLRRTYGITESEFMLLKESQEHQCAICGKVTAATLHVDHQHTVGEKAILKEKGHAIIRKNVRGLLCMACNRGLAAFRDNAELFEKAAIYLKNWPAKKIIKR
jgi:5-methylcytosine-specific restriction endonuclease McrA